MFPPLMYRRERKGNEDEEEEEAEGDENLFECTSRM